MSGDKYRRGAAGPPYYRPPVNMSEPHALWRSLKHGEAWEIEHMTQLQTVVAFGPDSGEAPTVGVLLVRRCVPSILERVEERWLESMPFRAFRPNSEHVLPPWAHLDIPTLQGGDEVKLWLDSDPPETHGWSLVVTYLELRR